ncbi:hypothetical protein BC059799_3147 [Bacillus cereus NVH0597-99]|nr:hypothetical protein BC059799_3147 [Bacillus cereus NVH0597-99]
MDNPLLFIFWKAGAYHFIKTTISPQTHSLKQLKEMIIRIALKSLKMQQGNPSNRS